MDEHPLQAVLARDPQQRIEMLLVRVHAAVRHQPEQMQLPPAFTRPLHGLAQWSAFFANSPEAIWRVNARDVHLHNAPRADIQVAHFAVAHLPVGQTDKMLATRESAC